MAHAPGGFLRQTQGHHFVIRKSGAVEEQELSPGKPFQNAFVDLGAARHIKETFLAVADLKSDGRLGFSADIEVVAFEIKRNFPGTAKGGDESARGRYRRDTRA